MSEDGSSSSSTASANAQRLIKRHVVDASSDGVDEKTKSTNSDSAGERKRPRFTVQNLETFKLATEKAEDGQEVKGQQANDVCEKTSSVGTTNSPLLPTNSASTPIEESKLEPDAVAATSTASINFKGTKEEMLKEVKRTEGSIVSVANDNVVPMAQAAAAQGNDLNTNTTTEAVGDENPPEETPDRCFLNIRRRRYRRSGQRIFSFSSDSSENSLSNANHAGGSGNNAAGAVTPDYDAVNAGILDGGDRAVARPVNYSEPRIPNFDISDDSSSSDGSSIDTNFFRRDDDDDDGSDVAFELHTDSDSSVDDYNDLPFTSRRRFNHPSRLRGVMFQRPTENEPTAASVDAEAEALLGKRLPAINRNLLKDVMNREHGFSNRYMASLSPQHSTFNNRFYGSLFVIERMNLSHRLHKHNGCVNSLNFNRCGNLLCSGSDDRRIVVWKWAQKKALFCIPSGHRENIFQTKFLASDTGLDIISAGRDAQVRRALVEPSGRTVTKCLYKHRYAVHNLVICPNSKFEFLSAGEDGQIRHCDLRCDPQANSLLTIVKQTKKRSSGGSEVMLFGMTHHPFAPEIAVCGSDEYVRVYDRRKPDAPARMFFPAGCIHKTRLELDYSQITHCTYNHNGSEILATYSDQKIFLFDNKSNSIGTFLHSYNGHYNNRTVKGVSFFGPNSEFVVSGSDCGNIFFWDKETEAILNMVSGDDTGVVNCLESHPTFPVLATSGLDHNVKIWMPGSQKTVPAREKLKRCICKNIRSSMSKCGIQLLNRALSDLLMPIVGSSNLENRRDYDDDSYFGIVDALVTDQNSDSDSTSHSPTDSDDNNSTFHNNA